MMELKITEFFNAADPFTYSHSVCEGGPHAGPNTWQAAKDADFQLLTNDEERQAFRDHIKGFGAWDEAQIAAMSDNDLNALCIQLVSGDIREAGLDNVRTDEEWQAFMDDENASGRMFKSFDSGEVYYYLGD